MVLSHVSFYCIHVFFRLARRKKCVFLEKRQNCLDVLPLRDIYSFAYTYRGSDERNILITCIAGGKEENRTWETS